jgi:hypothetical protein
MRQEANVVEDARNDKLSPKFSKKKELRRHSKHHKIMVVRNSHTNNDDVTAARDLPEGVAEPKSNNHHSLTLSRLLFTKQHMEQRDQVKVVYNQFSPNAVDVLTIQPDDGMPSPDQPDHVVIKVQVSFFACCLSPLAAPVSTGSLFSNFFLKLLRPTIGVDSYIRRLFNATWF